MGEVEYRVLLSLGDDLPADRLCALLQAVDQLGSIRQAAAALSLSYRYAWGLIKRAETRLGKPLLTRRVGGAKGGGAALTEDAQALLADYLQFRLEVEKGASRTLGRWEQEPTTGASSCAAQPLLLASTIGPVETGLLPALEKAYHDDSGVLVRHIAAGTGQALAIAREGRADLVLVHAPKLEMQFLAEGWTDRRTPLMYNDFILMGPAADPAGVGSAKSAVEAFRAIARAGAPFVTRGDGSGTHIREEELWEAAGVKPASPWYQVCPQGYMGSGTALRWADSREAYILVDRAAWLAGRAHGIRLQPLFKGDSVLRNEFSLMAVSPIKNPRAKYVQACRFITWATGPRGQALIGRFGLELYGETIFGLWE